MVEPRFWPKDLEGWSSGFLRPGRLPKEGLQGDVQPSSGHDKFKKPEESPNEFGKDTEENPPPPPSREAISGGGWVGEGAL